LAFNSGQFLFTSAITIANVRLVDMMRLYILLILILPITVYAQIEITEEEKSLLDSL
jgi:hypothetical protein